MPRILVEIDTAKLLNHTSSLQDREIFAEMLSAMDDDDIVNEVVKRELLDDVFCSSSDREKQSIIEHWAEYYDYVKKEE